MVVRISSVGVIDKSMAVLHAIADGADSLASVVEVTGISRATAHRMAAALTDHGLVRRLPDGRYELGYELWSLGQRVAGPTALAELAQPVLDQLRDSTGESAQLFVADGDERLCVAVAESGHGLRTIVAIGARLPLGRGSGGAALTSPAAGGWLESVAEREAGVASVSAPVQTADGRVLAAISVSGPIERLGESPGERHGATVAAAAGQLGKLLGERASR